MASMLPYVPSIIGAGLGYLATRGSNARAAKEAALNRKFQLDASNTAHQREVQDLIRSGLNPILSANHGASSPGGGQAPVEDVGEGASRGIASALAVKQAQANIELTRAQASQAGESAAYTRAQQADLAAQVGVGRYKEFGNRATLSDMDVEQRLKLYPLALQQAQEEIRRTASSARAAEASAALDEAARAGAINDEDFNKLIGEFGPGVRFFLQLLRGVRR